METLKKITQKQVKLVIVLVTLIIVVFSYFFGYQKFNSKAEILDRENKTLISNKNELKEKHKKKEFLIKETKEMRERIVLLEDMFPSYLSQDKNIMFIHDLANYARMDVKVMSFSENQLFYPVTGLGATDNVNLIGYKTTVTISYSSTYEGLKTCINYIHSRNDRMNIPSFNAAFDNTTGNLSGTMTIDMYALIGTGRLFEAAIIEGVPIGTDNIFGTFENPMNTEQSLDESE